MRASGNDGASGNREVVVRSLDKFASVAVIGGEHSLVIDVPAKSRARGRLPTPSA